MKTRILKNSGIEWIGQIPKHWEVIRNKYIINGIYSGGTPTSGQAEFYTDDESGIPFVSISDMSKTNYLEFTKTKVTKLGIANKNLKILKPNTIIYSIYATIGEVAEILCPATISQALLALFVKTSYNKQFYKYNLKAMKDFIFFQSNGNTQFNLNAKKILNFYFVLPPLAEQERIAGFLDNKCASIDSSIENLEQKTKSLAQYKKALITQCVTKGLNPKILEFKDSGIPWIRQIPKHWEVRPLYYFFKERKNKNLLGKEKNLLSLSYGKIIRKDIETKYGLLPENFNAYNIIEKDDIVFRFTDLQNDKVSLRTGLVCEKGIITSAYITITPKRNICVSFYHYLLHCYDLMKVFYNFGNGVRQGLTYKELSKMKILVPPLNEQKEIAEFLDNKCEKIDNLSANYKEQIKTLKEYKQALIYECVTGKKQI